MARGNKKYPTADEVAVEAKKRKAAAKKIRQKGAWRQFEDKDRVLARLRHRGYHEFAQRLERDDKPLPAKLETSGTAEARGSRFLVGTAKGRPPPSMSTSFLIDGESVRRAVARVVLGSAKVSKGSGFLVGPHFFMTNNHVLGSIKTARRASAQFDFVKTSEPTTPGQLHALDPDKFFYTNKKLDFTIVGIKDESATGRTLSDRGWIRLIRDPGKAITNERVNIIQHPRGTRQKVTLRQNQVVMTYNSFIVYKTNTYGGSSGSPVLNDQWQLVALHTETDGNLNYGVRISEIARDLDRIIKDHPDLNGCFEQVPPALLRKARGMIFMWQEMLDGMDGTQPPDRPPSGFARDAAAWDALSAP